MKIICISILLIYLKFMVFCFFFFESIYKKICLIIILFIILFLMDFNKIIKLFYYFLMKIDFGDKNSYEDYSSKIIFY